MLNPCAGLAWLQSNDLDPPVQPAYRVNIPGTALTHAGMPLFAAATTRLSGLSPNVPALHR